MTDETEFVNEMSNSLEENDRFYTILSQIEDCLAKDLSIDPKPVIVSSSVTPSPSPRTQQVVLPKIELPKFDGNIVNWQTFWDQFESSVHKQEGLSHIHKFNYLKSLLTSTASECIAGLAMTNENYEEAVSLLKERFGNKQLLIDAYVESFIDLPAVKSMNQVKDLRSVYDQLETTVRNLRSLNVETQTYGYFLVPVLRQKLPNVLRMIMSRNFKNDIWEMTQVLIFFRMNSKRKNVVHFLLM